MNKHQRSQKCRKQNIKNCDYFKDEGEKILSSPKAAKVCRCDQSDAHVWRQMQPQRFSAAASQTALKAAAVQTESDETVISTAPRGEREGEEADGEEEEGEESKQVTGSLSSVGVRDPPSHP